MNTVSFKLSALFGLLLGLVLPSFGQNCIYPGQTEIYFQNSFCGSNGDLCLDIPYAQRNDYNIYLDGVLYSDSYLPCNYDTTSVYSVSDIVNFPDPNPDFFLDSLIIDGVIYSFSFVTITDLVDSMNVIDAEGDWNYDVGTRTIRGGVKGTEYSWLYLTERKSGTVIQQRIDFFSLPRGLVIQVPNGLYELVIDEIATPCSDTLTLEILCVNNDHVQDTVYLNDIDTICFNIDDLRGTPNTIVNICPTSSGEFALIEPIPGSNCIEVTGVDLGQDSACLVITDDLGLMDTIYYSVIVLMADDSVAFQANDDTYNSTMNTTFTFNPTSNDDFPNALDTIFISQEPSNGTASVNDDGTITYVPNPGYQSSGDPDSLTYTICIGLDCRTATIYIGINPSELEFVSAFTPNADGVNDLFVIGNLEQYPNNELTIFNRWGNRVYRAEQYQNDWDGQWDNTTTLPDGVYFYVLDVELDSGMEQISGYVVIKR